MSRYHVLPRDSMESEEREAREFLIPSPVSNVHSASGLPSARTCTISFRPSTHLRLFSTVCALVGLLVVVINTPPIGALVAMAVFFGLIFVTNIIRLISRPFTGQSSIRVAIYYKDRDILARPDGSQYRPSFFTFLDIAWCIGLLVATTIWKPQFYAYWWQETQPIVGSVFAGICIFIQLLISIPIVDRLGFTIRGNVRPSQQIFLGSDIVQPLPVKDRKEPVMTGAVEVGPEPEASAIPLPQPAGGDASDLV